MSAVPHPRPTRRQRARHGGALLAALAYGLAAFAIYQLVAPSLHRDADPAGAEPAAAAAPPVQGDLGTTAPRELLALRAAASRVQRSVYTVRAGGATWGSAFVAWVRQGKVSFVLTARAAVAGSAGDLFLKRDGQSLRARVVGGHAATGLALLRVNAALDRPLWRDAGDRGALRAKTTAVIVPAGRSGAFGEGKLSREPRRFSLEAGGGARYLGAPVLDENGQLAGIVVEQLASGESRIVPLADACGRIRACG